MHYEGGREVKGILKTERLILRKWDERIEGVGYVQVRL